jgi:hypothetical protein
LLKLNGAGEGNRTLVCVVQSGAEFTNSSTLLRDWQFIRNTSFHHKAVSSHVDNLSGYHSICRRATPSNLLDFISSEGKVKTNWGK